MTGTHETLKIGIVGGYGVGKTTMIRSVTEIRTLQSATTVAFDFGRITLDERSVLYLFGAPGQERFWFLWERLFAGVIGAVVLVDTRSLTDSRHALDHLEHHGTPFIVAVNDFGGPFHSEDRIRETLALGPDVPLVEFDARDHSSSKFVLIALVEHLNALSVLKDD